MHDASDTTALCNRTLSTQESMQSGNLIQYKMRETREIIMAIITLALRTQSTVNYISLITLCSMCVYSKYEYV